LPTTICCWTWGCDTPRKSIAVKTTLRIGWILLLPRPRSGGALLEFARCICGRPPLLRGLPIATSRDDPGGDRRRAPGNHPSPPRFRELAPRNNPAHTTAPARLPHRRAGRRARFGVCGFSTRIGRVSSATTDAGPGGPRFISPLLGPRGGRSLSVCGCGDSASPTAGMGVCCFMPSVPSSCTARSFGRPDHQSLLIFSS